MSQDDFFGPEWDLANIAANTIWGDSFLIDLIEDAETGVRSLIGVLTNGMIVMGTVSSAAEIAKELDRQREVASKAIQRPDDLSSEDWGERLKVWTSRHSRAYEAAVEERHEVDEKIEAEEPKWDYSVPPRGLPREALETGVRTMLTLTGVQVVAPGQSGIMRAAVVRLDLRQISGWWPIQTDEDGKASFRLFSAEDE